MTIADVLRYTVEEIGGDSLGVFYTKDTWKRRDALKTLVPKLLKDKGSLQVICRSSMDADEKAMLAAISPYSTVEYTARAQ